MAWVSRCLVGKITKAELDEERRKETNALDMMQNSSIIYHTESILEAQIISLIFCYVLTNTWDASLFYGQKSGKALDSAIINFGLTQHEFTEVMMLILLIEHVFSYCSGIFKAWELKTRGVANEKGIETAKYGSILYWIEIGIDVLVIILVIIHFAQMGDMSLMHDLPLLNYWILFDTVIMFLTLPYMALAKHLIVKGEITKNIFTLYQVQRRKLKKRREQVKPSNQNQYK